jgi:hypothetical protein
MNIVGGQLVSLTEDTATGISPGAGAYSRARRLRHRRGRISISGSGVVNFFGDHTYANLDTGQDKKVPRSEAGISAAAAASVSTIGGTQVAAWHGFGRPTLLTCSSLPPQLWSTTVRIFRNLGAMWCVHTSRGRYGIMEYVAANTYHEFSHAVWKKPGDQ